MGVAYYIVLERGIDGLDTMIDGKMLAKRIKSLDKAAKQAGIRPLSDFFSVDPEMLADFSDDDTVEMDGVELPKYHSPQDGLDTVQALLRLPSVKGADVEDDLQECERILKTAVQNGVGWYLAIDI